MEIDDVVAAVGFYFKLEAFHGLIHHIDSEWKEFRLLPVLAGGAIGKGFGL